jgi:hypothetical protein
MKVCFCVCACVISVGVTWVNCAAYFRHFTSLADGEYIQDMRAYVVQVDVTCIEGHQQNCVVAFDVSCLIQPLRVAGTVTLANPDALSRPD